MGICTYHRRETRVCRPLFVKYNAVLRGLDSDVVFLRNDMVQRCCAKAKAGEYMGGAKTWEAARGTLSYKAIRSEHLNTYVTTLHAINSSIVKLSKLTVASKVFRGIDNQTRCCVHKGRILASNNGSVLEFDSGTAKDTLVTLAPVLRLYSSLSGRQYHNSVFYLGIDVFHYEF